MRALVFRGPGSMPLEDRPDPVPERGEVVVAIEASGICGSDVHGFRGATGRRTVGVVMGHEAAGTVVATGPETTGRRVGDRVALRSILGCGACDRCRSGRSNICLVRRGLGMHLDGAYAELVVVPSSLAVAIPDELAAETAALAEPLAVALHAVAITPIRPTDVVAIVGAGPIGLLALLAVRRHGAGTILVTDRDAHRLEVARSLGADLAIDVGREDAVAVVGGLTGARGADVVFEAVGVAASIAQSVALASPGGHVTWVGNSAPEATLPIQDIVTRELTIRGSYGFVDEFEGAIALLAAGEIDVGPLIERRAPLEDGEELFRELAAGRLAAVKVVLVRERRAT
jgi:L-iditol 2-dehydrogenase